MGAGKKSRISGMILPVVLLVFAISSTSGLYAYNLYLEKQNSKVVENIADLDTKINDVKKDPNLQIYDLLKVNKKAIATLSSYSQVPTFIDRLDMIEQTYKITFEKFNYSNGVVSSEIETSGGSSILGYELAANFIKQYRLDKNAYFHLSFISGVEGTKKIGMNIELKAKDILPIDTSSNHKLKSVKSIKKKAIKAEILKKIQNRKKEQQGKNEREKKNEKEEKK